MRCPTSCHSDKYLHQETPRANYICTSWLLDLPAALTLRGCEALVFLLSIILTSSVSRTKPLKFIDSQPLCHRPLWRQLERLQCVSCTVCYMVGRSIWYFVGEFQEFWSRRKSGIRKACHDEVCSHRFKWSGDSCVALKVNSCKDILTPQPCVSSWQSLHQSHIWSFPLPQASFHLLLGVLMTQLFWMKTTPIHQVTVQ
jgi:hypothetical protein